LVFRGVAQHARIAVVPSYGNTLIYIAKVQGLFDDEGVDVELVQVPNSRASVAAVATGTVDLGSSFEMPLLRAALEGKSLVVVTELHSSLSKTSVVYRLASGIRRPEDLAGRKIGILVGTSAEFVLDLLLSSRGIPLSSVNAVDLPWDKHREAMVNGDVDAVVTWGPMATELVASRDVPMSVFTTDFYTEINSLIGARQRVVEKREAIVRTLRALKRSQDFFRENPVRSREIALRFIAPRAKYGTSLFWDKMSPHIGLSSVLLTTLKDEAEWLRRKQGKTVELNVRDVVDPTFLAHVLPESVTYE
jgi:NitT/TauT family transport system substrate-binding protein